MDEKRSEEQLYRVARRRVEAKKGFFIHLTVYVCVNSLLAVIWAVTGRGFPWFVFPLGGWGIGVLFNFLGVFVFSRQSDWERRQIEKEVDRLRRDGN